ncbi:MAG: cation:proton antiporter, partial [Clostridia bacterium]|nr:cation:proton antiporter [Clostridia bacterium]
MTNENVLNVIFQLAVILLATKLVGLLARKIGLPEVVGNIIAGLLLGTAIWGSSGWLIPIEPSDVLKVFSKIGVILILFKAGLETDLKTMK